MARLNRIQQLTKVLLVMLVFSSVVYFGDLNRFTGYANYDQCQHYYNKWNDKSWFNDWQWFKDECGNYYDLPECGNGILEPGEDCDDDEIMDCQMLGYSTGNLICVDCEFYTAGCIYTTEPEPYAKCDEAEEELLTCEEKTEELEDDYDYVLDDLDDCEEYLEKIWQDITECQTNNECTDTDEGINPYLSGVVTTPLYNMSLSDYCIDSNNLKEFYCTSVLYPDDKTGYYNETYQCTNGCENGACLEETVYRCSDTDGGIKYYINGSTTGMIKIGPMEQEATMDDNCCSGTSCNLIEGDELMETYCEGDYLKTVKYECKCQEGACIAPYIIQEDFGLISYLMIKKDQWQEFVFEDNPVSETVKGIYTYDIEVLIQEHEEEISKEDFISNVVEKYEDEGIEMYYNELDNNNLYCTDDDYDLFFCVWISDNYLIKMEITKDFQDMKDDDYFGESYFIMISAYLEKYESFLTGDDIIQRLSDKQTILTNNTLFKRFIKFS